MCAMALQETFLRGLHHVAYNNRKYKSKLSSCTVPINFTEGWMMSCVPRCKNRKQAGDISWLHHWLTREMTSEERPQKFHTDHVVIKN